MLSTSPSLLAQLKNSSSNTLAWHRFVELYTPLLMYWIRRTGLNASDSADIVQEVLITMTVRLPSFQYDKSTPSFRAWLRKVTVIKCRDLMRKKVTREIHEALKHVDEKPTEQSIFSDQEFHQLLAKRALQMMQSEFETSTWRACWETTVNDRPAAEVAQELGMTVNAVYLAKARVLKRLRDKLDGMI